MFNAEQLLGKMLAGAMSSGSRSGGIGSSLASQLSAGGGLMTLIGLGVGAFEILKNQNAAPPPGQVAPPPLSTSASTPPPLPGRKNPAPACPPPLKPSSPEGLPAIPEAGGTNTPAVQFDGPQLAHRMIQAMIAAAAADGQIDSEEEAKILEKFRQHELNREEKLVLLQELQNPKSIDQLTAGIHQPVVAQTMYSVAALAITIDTDAERKWLDRLALALGISPAMQHFLEEKSR
jgi:Protein of unknown function (DUF533)